jgi:hypothetical protein
MSMKNSNDTNGNRIRDLPACRAVPQPTAPPQIKVREFITHEHSSIPIFSGHYTGPGMNEMQSLYLKLNFSGYFTY